MPRFSCHKIVHLLPDEQRAPDGKAEPVITSVVKLKSGSSNRSFLLCSASIVLNCAKTEFRSMERQPWRAKL